MSTFPSQHARIELLDRLTRGTVLPWPKGPLDLETSGKQSKITGCVLEIPEALYKVCVDSESIQVWRWEDMILYDTHGSFPYLLVWRASDRPLGRRLTYNECQQFISIFGLEPHPEMANPQMPVMDRLRWLTRDGANDWDPFWASSLGETLYLMQNHGVLQVPEEVYRRHESSLPVFFRLDETFVVDVGHDLARLYWSYEGNFYCRQLSERETRDLREDIELSSQAPTTP